MTGGLLPEKSGLEPENHVDNHLLVGERARC